MAEPTPTPLRDRFSFYFWRDHTWHRKHWTLSFMRVVVTVSWWGRRPLPEDDDD